MSIRTCVLLKAVVLLGFIAVHANPTENTDEIQCSSGWQRIHRACYMLVTEELSWSEAFDHCIEHDGELTVIESLREKEELEKYLLADSPGVKKFWVGLTRRLDNGDDWRWLGKDNLPLAANMISWSNPLLKDRQGRVCGMIDTTAKKLQVGATRCTSEQPFICEFHKIVTRQIPVYEPSTIAVIDVIKETTDQPLTTLSQTTDNCPCRDSTSNILTNDASDSNEDRLRRRNQALSVDEELYQRYLQSEIDANNAKVMYYSKVTKLYQDALEKQNQYYSSHQTKLDLEITRLRQGSTCT